MKLTHVALALVLSCSSLACKSTPPEEQAAPAAASTEAAAEEGEAAAEGEGTDQVRKEDAAPAAKEEPKAEKKITGVVTKVEGQKVTIKTKNGPQTVTIAEDATITRGKEKQEMSAIGNKEKIRVTCTEEEAEVTCHKVELATKKGKKKG